MTIHVVGGVYRERCIHPHWNDVYGSAGRAALAIATLGRSVILHSYMSDEVFQIIKEKGSWQTEFDAMQVNIDRTVSFKYLHDLATPEISGVPDLPYSRFIVSEERVVRFGMLEGDAEVHAKWVVYDAQNASNPRPYRENGSTAGHLALVVNAREAVRMSGMPNSDPAQTAAVLAQQQMAEVVVIKMGPQGAFVWTAERSAQVPAFRTSHVWKIGSGDCFVAHFANAWMSEGRSPIEAAEIASNATAYYCDTQGLPTRDALANSKFEPVQISQAISAGASRMIYLAGPFFDLSQIWMVQLARTTLLDMGLRVFSPYHDIGIGSAESVVPKDLAGIRESDLVFAITDGLDAGTLYEIGYARAHNKPVVVYSERHSSESLKMMEGSGCTICSDYTSAIYSAMWEALRI